MPIGIQDALQGHYHTQAESMHEFASPHHAGPEHNTEYLEIDEALFLVSILKLDKEAQVGETQREAAKCWNEHAKST